MAMSKGSVTINPTTGAASGTGAAKEMFDALDANIDYQSLAGSQLAAQRQQIADLANAMSEVIDHITTNAVISTILDLGIVAPGVTVGSGSSGAITGTTTGTVS